MGARRLAILFVSAALAAAGCGSQGGGTGAAGSIGSASSGAQSALAIAGPQTVAKGATFTAEVALAMPVRDLYGAGFELRYNPAVVEYISTDTSRSSFASTRGASALRGGKPGA